MAETFVLNYYQNIAEEEFAKAEKCLKKLAKMKQETNDLIQSCQDLNKDCSRMQERCTKLNRGNVELKKTISKHNEQIKDIIYLDKVIDHLNDVASKMKLVPLVVDVDSEEV